MQRSLSVPELLILDQHNWTNSFRHGSGFSWASDPAKSNTDEYTLFRSEDRLAWILFTLIFIFLIAFDNLVLHRDPGTLTIARAVVFTVFWIICACGFCGGVYFYYGADDAFMWMSGYILEWMLSFDNLFVFHMIFTVYGTPDELKHRPLFLGILGAVFFRLIFIFIGEYLIHTFYFVHFIFGAILVYSGIKTITFDEEDEDPSKHPFIVWLTSYVPFVNVYDKHGAFFVHIRADTETPREATLEPSEKDALTAGEADEQGDGSPRAKRFYGTVDFAAQAGRSNGRGASERQTSGTSGGSSDSAKAAVKTKATMLFLVLICLEVSDLVFAVDSVSAIVAQVPDLFLAYTSTVFAMLGLRATFFIIDELARLFALLKYGVAAVLVFIGIKLIITPIYKISPLVVCAILIGSLVASVLASVVVEAFNRRSEQQGAISQDEKARNPQGSVA